jgi:hypothetical protein
LNKNNHKKAKKLYYQVILLGCIALVGSGYFMAHSLFVVMRYHKVQAEVISVKKTYQHAGDTTRTYIPTVQFKTKDGKTFTARTSHASSTYDFSKGDIIPVYYNPQQPGTIKIGTFMSMWPGPMIGLTLAAIIFWSSRGLKPAPDTSLE